LSGRRQFALADLASLSSRKQPLTVLNLTALGRLRSFQTIQVRWGGWSPSNVSVRAQNLEYQLARVSAKALIADEICYGLNHWGGLTRFLDAGRSELTSLNVASVPLCSIARTHSSPAACVASLIETCKLNDVDPQAYFTNVLTKLVNLWPASRIDELMPWSGRPTLNQQAHGITPARKDSWGQKTA
jgi:hypothetical protein